MFGKIKKYFKHLSAKNRGVSQEVINFVETYYNDPERFYFKDLLVGNKYLVGYEVATQEDGFILTNGLTEYKNVLKGNLGKVSDALSGDNISCYTRFSILLDKKLGKVYTFKQEQGTCSEFNGKLDFLDEWEWEYIGNNLIVPEVLKQRAELVAEDLIKRDNARVKMQIEQNSKRKEFGEMYE